MNAFIDPSDALAEASPAVGKRLRTAVCALVLVIVATAGPVACKPTAPGEVVLAEVGGRRITASDLRLEASRRHAARMPVPDKETLLQELVVHAALLESAEKAGTSKDPQVRRELENLLIGHWKDREWNRRIEAVTVTEQEVQAEFERNRDRYTRPAQARFAVLSLKADAGRTPADRRSELRARMEEALRGSRSASAQSPRDGGQIGFGAISAQYSDDQVSRYRGGDLGWIERGKEPTRIPAEVMETGWYLAVGEVSAVIDTAEGFYLVMKCDDRQATVTPFEQVRGSLHQALLSRKRKETEESFRKEAVAMTAARTHLEALASVDLPGRETMMARKDDREPPPLPGGTQAPHGH